MLLILVTVVLHTTQGSIAHINCSRICSSPGQPVSHGGHHGVTGGARDQEPAYSHHHCYGSYCVVTTATYNRLEVPQPWLQPPVAGAQQGGADTGCMDGSTSVLQVLTRFNIIEVSNIDSTHGTLDIKVRVKMTWSDPNLAVCDCQGKQRSSYRVGNNFEDMMWVPDLEVFNSKNFRRVSGLVKLGFLQIQLGDHCSPRVTQAYDMMATLFCGMDVSRFPMDRNICHVRLGSYNHPSTRLAFIEEEPRLAHHHFEEKPYRDFHIKVKPMASTLMEVNTIGYRGERSTLRVTGASLLIGRNVGAVIIEYLVVMVALVLGAVLTLLLPNPDPNLLAFFVLSGIFTLLSAKDTTPHPRGGLNLVLKYILYSLIFMFATFVYQCLGFYTLIWRNDLLTGFGRYPNLFRKDKLFFLIILVAYVVYNMVFWYILASQGGTSCNNANMLNCEYIHN